MKASVFVLLLLSSLITYSQGTASSELISEHLDEITLLHVEAIDLLMNGDIVKIQAPANTFMLEVIDNKGKVVLQNPINHFISIETSSWKSGNYTILAHTFNGLKSRTFNIQGH
jgi:hypothetical protein